MMDFIRTWLLGITGAAIIAALCESLTPPGSVRRVGRIAGGLLLMLAILRPAIGLDYAALSGALADYRAKAAGWDQTLQIENTKLMKTIIEEQASAYIQDKAESLGMSCTVTVTCEYGGRDFPTPVAVKVTGQFTEPQVTALRRTIEADFAVPASQQIFERNVDEYE